MRLTSSSLVEAFELEELGPGPSSGPLGLCSQAAFEIFAVSSIPKASSPLESSSALDYLARFLERGTD